MAKLTLFSLTDIEYKYFLADARTQYIVYVVVSSFADLYYVLHLLYFPLTKINVVGT